MRRELNGDQSQQDSALRTLDGDADRQVRQLTKQLERAQRQGDAARVDQLTAELAPLTDRTLRNRTLVAQAAVIKYGADALNHSVADTIGSNSGVIPLDDAVAPPLSSGPDIHVVGERLSPTLHRESQVGRVVVDSLNYGKGLVDRYGTSAEFAIAGVKFLATGGVAPLVSLAVGQGVNAVIPNLPDAILSPIARGGAAVEDFAGGGGGSILLSKDRDDVSDQDRSGVTFGITTVLGFGLGAIAGRAGYVLGQRYRAATRSLVKEAHIAEMTANGVKFNPGAVIATGRNAAGQVVFLETGNARAGLRHIEQHAAQFADIGVPKAQIPSVVMEAVTEGNLVGTQGKSREIYEIMLNQQRQRIAVTVGSNGFIVGANPAGRVP